MTPKQLPSSSPSTEITTFDFSPSIRLRALTIDGAPWFVAKDICDALGLEDRYKATSTLDEDEKGTTTVRTIQGNQKAITVNESGLYSLVLRSRKPEAKRFKKWVTSEVLPAIRKTGTYSSPAAAPTVQHQQHQQEPHQGPQEVLQALLTVSRIAETALNLLSRLQPSTPEAQELIGMDLSSPLTRTKRLSFKMTPLEVAVCEDSPSTSPACTS